VGRESAGGDHGRCFRCVSSGCSTERDQRSAGSSRLREGSQLQDQTERLILNQQKAGPEQGFGFFPREIYIGYNEEGVQPARNKRLLRSNPNLFFYFLKEVMKDKIKKHVKKYKVVYSCAATGIVVAGITSVIMRRNIMSQHIGRGISVTANRGISVVADRSAVTNSVSFISSRRQGAPSWVIRCVETGRIFTSQLSASTEMQLPASEISKHLNGVMDNVRGYTFERICMAA
jgi:hypothetical protein